MYDQITTNPAIVVHGTSATVFGAVGAAVPTDARMGVAESAAIAALDRGNRPPNLGVRPALTFGPALRLATSAGRP